MAATAAKKVTATRLSPIPGALAAVVIVPGQYYVQYLDGGAEHIKPVSPATAHAILRHEDIDTGWLSPGVVRCAETIKGPMVLSYRPPSKATILLDGRSGTPDELTVPLPGLVLVGVDTKYYLWAVQGDAFQPNATLFNAPLPNINTDGSICFGSNKVGRAAGHSMSKVWELIWSSPFSDHSVQGKSQKNQKDIRAGLRELARKRAKTYPPFDLVKFSYGPTVSRAWESIVSNGKVY